MRGLRRLAGLLCVCASTGWGQATAPAAPKPRVLVFFSEKTEADHVDFAHQANDFFSKQGEADGFAWVATTHWDDLNAQELARTRLVVWLNDEPSTAAQKKAFEEYMDHGGSWLGFHVSAYNDRDSQWPLVSEHFLGARFFTWQQLAAAACGSRCG